MLLKNKLYLICKKINSNLLCIFKSLGISLQSLSDINMYVFQILGYSAALVLEIREHIKVWSWTSFSLAKSMEQNSELVVSVLTLWVQMTWVKGKCALFCPKANPEWGFSQKGEMEQMGGLTSLAVLQISWVIRLTVVEFWWSLTLNSSGK